jgi:hypothetical protein
MGPFIIGVCHISYNIGNLMYVGRLIFLMGDFMSCNFRNPKCSSVDPKVLTYDLETITKFIII